MSRLVKQATDHNSRDNGVHNLSLLAALGDGWQTKSTTGQAALTVLPTTVAGLSLYNGDASKVYAIHSFGSWEAVVDATQGDITAIFAMNNLPANVTPPADGGLVKASLSGTGTYAAGGGAARSAVGGTVVNDGWFAHGTGAPMSNAVAGDNWKVNEVKCEGMYLVPPGGMFSIQAVKAAAAAAAQQFYYIRWHELLIPYK